MSSDTWPPQLKEWVAKCLGQMTDGNRAEAQAELRQVIADAFTAKTLWTTDWAGVQLKSLQPKSPPGLNGLKRKSLFLPSAEIPLQTKKAKKAQKNLPVVPDFNDQAALSRRAQRFRREHELERKKNHHGHLFHNADASRSFSPSSFAADDPEASSNTMDWDRFAIVGTSKEIFKDYLRLTSEPKPEQIRPFPVLQQTLAALKQRWKEQASGQTSYNWICSQFKSLRQDLTVQRIKNDFTVQVYEIHARMALEIGDMVEYNACQAMLRGLYELGIPGKVEEFTAYRILMLLHGQNRSELTLYVGQLTPQQKSHPAVKHALDVQRALATGNYHAFFALYLNAPNMGGYIMDHFVERERVKALMVVTKAYRTVPLTFVHRELAFDDLPSTRDFLSELKAATFTNPNAADKDKVIECKPAVAPLQQAFEEKYRKVQLKGRI
ncbi:hypothetical protein PUNSTDRAFT_106371 [Punctularia strigosozonata HHB-11173 SS5]|uniref:uncharacterized protein n=1 Tax=Punctularia strigosozonata (strain HHB-11173) TaxID=741275 RepID=UPI0004418325|nr:uncharacterized protein PUNSTDRAFT_106371 [Punctularia strigosozonata HHB-11173 SS5]EIN06164.1 hypothetical protein PUNSTDRAFT_106371 [Punctularia strigosozonata HHB-11173 SS5]